jgi:hypothetical protein
MKTERMELPIVCDLTVFSPEERKHHEEVSIQITKQAKRIVELEDGFEFHHDYSEEKFVGIAQWITGENKCCPFFTFELVIEPFNTGREIIVRLRGSKEIKRGLKGDLEKFGLHITP